MEKQGLHYWWKVLRRFKQRFVVKNELKSNETKKQTVDSKNLTQRSMTSPSVYTLVTKAFVCNLQRSQRVVKERCTLVTHSVAQACLGTLCCVMWFYMRCSNMGYATGWVDP